MKVKKSDSRSLSPLIFRLLRFWGPLFLFFYLIYVMIVWAFIPLRGPIAVIGRIIPVPVGAVDGADPFWYHRVLKVRDWYGDGYEKSEVLDFAAFSVLAESFGKEVGAYERSGFLRAHAREAHDVHALVVEAADAASEQGLYQQFAEERVAQMQGLIDLGIFFQDLAYQYTELPADWTSGVRIVEGEALPEAYVDSIDAEDPVLIELPDYFVFVRVIDLENGSYRVIELGIAKQNVRETLYAFLLNHSLRWF